MLDHFVDTIELLRCRLKITKYLILNMRVYFIYKTDSAESDSG